MKSISRRVVEIVEPQHPYIERVLVVLRADCPPVRVETQRAQAEKYVAALTCWRRKLWPEQARSPRALVLYGFVAALCGAAAYFVF